MSVAGIGLDLCAWHRMEAAISRHGDRFLKRIFTEAEVEYCQAKTKPFESYAARFAAKEATSKSLGAPLGISWHDVEVVPAIPGQASPCVLLFGLAKETADRMKIIRVLLSLTHAEGMAAAMAVAVTA